MNNYIFVDVSHHKGRLDHQVFADAGHRLGITKFSDNYHLPKEDGTYDIPAEIHVDSQAVRNYVGFREVGLAAGGYHFARFDRPLGATKAQIVEKNLEYYLEAISRLPIKYQDGFSTAILDVEQPASQLNAAGLSKSLVSAMTVEIVKLFYGRFDKLIFYSGSWWTDQWLLPEDSTLIASMAWCWEPEYMSYGLSMDKQHVGSLRENYIPSVPKGFKPEFMLSANDGPGLLFAHQFSDRGRFPPHQSNIDINRTELNKEEIFKIFNTDGAVDPPGGGDGDGTIDLGPIIEQLDVIEGGVMTIHADLQSHHTTVMESLEAMQGGNIPEPPQQQQKYVSVYTDSGNLALSYAPAYNDTPRPIWQYWPSDSSLVKDRIRVKSGSLVPVKGNPIKGDGGNICYMVDRSRIDELSIFSGVVPTDAEVKAKQSADVKNNHPDVAGELFVSARFVTGEVWK